MISQLLAALGGGAGGLAQGLQVRQAMQQQQQDADARKRSEALRESLAMLQARDQFGLVPQAQADQQHATGRVTEMLQSLQIPGVNASRDLARGPSMQPPPAVPDERERVVLGSDTFVVDPTRSAAGRQRAQTLEDQARALSLGQQQQDTANRRAFATLQAAFPGKGGAYDPSIDYTSIMERTASVEDRTTAFQNQRTLQDRSFGQQRALQAQREAADARTVGQASTPKPPTEGERAAEAFSVRARDADTALTAMKTQDLPTGAARLLGDFSANTQNDAFRNWNLYRKNFATAVLRKESGAAIGADEYKAVDAIYIPMPGDSPDLLKKKANNRALAIQQLQIMAGNAAGTSGPAPVPQSTYDAENPHR